jgi:hypothetical protein
MPTLEYSPMLPRILQLTSTVYNASKLECGKELWAFIDTAIVKPFSPLT